MATLLTVWQFVEFLWQLRKVRMLQCLVGAESLLRIELQERVRYRLALDDVVQPWKIVTQFPWSIETCNCKSQKKKTSQISKAKKARKHTLK